MKVWICDIGSYSDRYTTAVYSSEETARAMSKAYGWNDPEEYDLDPPVPPEVPQGLTYYEVRMRKDGSTDGFYRNVEPSANTGEDRHYKFDERFKWPEFRGMDHFVFYCWARDKEHAIKIANDRRIAWLATHS